MGENEREPQPGGPYADHRVPLVHQELSGYAVGIAPILDDGKNIDQSGLGSGTCIRVAGRFFVATAAHVIMGRPYNQNFILTPKTGQWSLRIVKGGLRGGGPRDELDVGWLELHGRAAGNAGRHFLDVTRIRTHCIGDEDLVVIGSPQQHQERWREEDGTPVLKANAGWWPTRGILDRRDLAEDVDSNRKIFLKWPGRREGHNGEWYEYPEPLGISGGGVWATNFSQTPWRPEFLQLVGIEYAVQRGPPDRYLRAFQMQVWLEMLREDAPELAKHIDPILAAGRFQIK